MPLGRQARATHNYHFCVITPIGPCMELGQAHGFPARLPDSGTASCGAQADGLMSRCVLTRGGPAGAFRHANRVDPKSTPPPRPWFVNMPHIKTYVYLVEPVVSKKPFSPGAAAHSYSEWRSSQNIHTERRCDVRHVYKLLGFKGESAWAPHDANGAAHYLGCAIIVPHASGEQRSR